jgi:type II secretory pathway pseudopilin PulG
MKTIPLVTRARKGMTLLELTVVIVVVLSLVGILFIGATGWKMGADRSTCVLNIRNAQSAVRAFQNMRAVPEGASIDMHADIIGPDNFLATDPACPGGGDYEHIDHMPFPGELALTCDLAGSQEHVPQGHGDW